MKMSSYRFVPVPLVLWVCVVIGNAQQNSPPSPIGPSPGVPNSTQGIGIAIIHSDSFYDPQNGISRLVNAIKKVDQDQSRKRELEGLQKRIEQLTTETSGPELAPATVQTKRDQLEQLKRDLQRKGEDAQEEYSRRLREALNPVQEDLEKAIKSFAAQRGIKLIFDSSKLDEAILYMSESIDLTRAFIVEFNRANPATPLN